MKVRLVIILVAVLASLTGGDIYAQRRITPVKGVKTEEKKVETDLTRLAERLDSQGNVVLVDTVTGMEYVDSTAIAPVRPGNIYPLWHAVTVGVNIWDPVMRMLGQHYGGIDVWGELSLHNRFKPIVELGVGMADDTPTDNNFTYKSKMAPYFKLGLNYNIFYNSNPDYQLCAGLRYGFSAFSFEIADATLDPGYWGEPVHFSIPSQSATAGYMEIVLGIKVKLVRNISLGWNFKFHSMLHEGKYQYGEPMYIPGYGKRNSSITGGFSVMYTLPLNKSVATGVKDSVE